MKRKQVIPGLVKVNPITAKREREIRMEQARQIMDRSISKYGR